MIFRSYTYPRCDWNWKKYKKSNPCVVFDTISSLKPRVLILYFTQIKWKTLLFLLLLTRLIHQFHFSDGLPWRWLLMCMGARSLILILLMKMWNNRPYKITTVMSKSIHPLCLLRLIVHFNIVIWGSLRSWPSSSSRRPSRSPRSTTIASATASFRGSRSNSSAEQFYKDYARETKSKYNLFRHPHPPPNHTMSAFTKSWSFMITLLLTWLRAYCSIVYLRTWLR